MAARRIITVLGATGHQGYSVVKAFAKDSAFEVRAGTRDINSAKAQALKQLGPNVTLCDANVSDPVSLKNAFSGSEFVFALTLGKDDKMSEFELGKRVVDIAKQENVGLLFWSSAPDSTAISGGKYTIPFYTDKAKVAEYLKKSGQPYVNLMLAMFLENLVDFRQLSRNEDGSLDFKIPLFSGEQVINTIWIKETLGRIVYYIATNYKEKPHLINGCVQCADDFMTLDQLADSISKRLGVPVKYSAMDEQTILKYKPEMAPVLVMYKFFLEFPVNRSYKSFTTRPIPKEVRPDLNEFIDTVLVPWYKTAQPKSW